MIISGLISYLLLHGYGTKARAVSSCIMLYYAPCIAICPWPSLSSIRSSSAHCQKCKFCLLMGLGRTHEHGCVLALLLVLASIWVRFCDINDDNLNWCAHSCLEVDGSIFDLCSIHVHASTCRSLKGVLTYCVVSGFGRAGNPAHIPHSCTKQSQT